MFIGSLDVTLAFLLTPIPKGNGFPVFALTPPGLLVRLGLAKEGELWVLTHAVYGERSLLSCGLTSRTANC